MPVPTYHYVCLKFGKFPHLNLPICAAGSGKPIVLFTNTINIDLIEAKSK